MNLEINTRSILKMQKQGFTLIELIIVIVILGILAVIAAPKFIDLQSDARIATLKGFKGAIEGANTMTRGYAVLHGLDQKDLKVGTAFKDAMVKYDGNTIVSTTIDNDERDGVFFLNLGYIATTNAVYRDSGLIQAIGKHTIKRSDGTIPEAMNVAYKGMSTQCPTSNEYGKNEVCYMASASYGLLWNTAYLVLPGYTPETCSLYYKAAYKESGTGAIIPPVMEIISSGC